MQPVNTSSSSPTADPKGKQSSDLPTAVSQAVSEAMRDQKKRQERLRHVQEFLTSPVFIDMKDQTLSTSSTRRELLERRNDLKYRINVMESMLGMLIEELDVLDRVIGDLPAAAAPEPVPSADPLKP